MLRQLCHRIINHPQLTFLQKKWLWGLTLLWALTSCVSKSNTVYSHFVDIPSEGWDKAQFCEYDTSLADSTAFCNPQARYDVILIVRHTDQYPYKTLNLSAQQSTDSCTQMPDKIMITLSDKNGKWISHHSKGIYTATDTILHSTPLPALYSLRLTHLMPIKKLTGLLSLGIIINQSN